MSTMDGGFRCQHGPEECRQNMIDSCVLSNLGKGAKQLQYVACRMQMPAFDDHVQKCAELQQVSWSDVVSCTTSGMGKDLQLEAERMTRQMTPGPRFVPTVVFNKVYNDLYQMEVERGGFDKVMCMDLQAC
ncbi:gamma-interferon-inducible lysosomal thiol reductase [Nilaparvata lugens]|uniref:gamma-interferon-inducible lysosomal thiol reductase n=1 Tax=Nilaparvata lugens TaxID=108931 RepID=UPI00193DD1AD|nr:gamma-interferon-inducible lysosomal thiol reductase [Nilaparvata lugens]XP_022189496.2 gamma-interferon-inducible lysosomal thiol reductase [Nilaparvata lugens]